MRTTVKLDKDVAAAVEQLKRAEGIGVSEAVNRIARIGLVAKRRPVRFKQPTARMGRFDMDVANVAEALEVAEGLERP